MKTANNLRLRLLDQHDLTNCGMVLSEMIGILLQNSPSCSEVACCKSNNRKDGIFPVIGLNNETFQNNFKNMEKAIMDNYPEDVVCVKCNSSSQILRTFGKHIFVEVKIR